MDHERQLYGSAKDPEDFKSALEHSTKLEKKFNKLKARDGTSLGGDQMQMRHSYTISELNSDHGQHGGHPLVEILPKAKCEDVKDYNHKGALDSLYLAKSIEQSALQSSQPSKVVSAT